MEGLSVQKIQCPTKCLSSLGTTSVAALFCLMSGCSLLRTAKQSKSSFPVFLFLFLKKNLPASVETHVTHFCQSEHPHNNNSTGGKRISNVQSYVWKLQIWLFADFPPFGSCSCWGTKQLLQMGFISPRSDVEVRLGEHDIWEVDGTEQHIMSAEFIRHPDYDSRTQDYRHHADQTEPARHPQRLRATCAASH